MKKKFLCLLMVLAISLTPVSLTASAETGTKYDDYLYYQTDSDNTCVTISDCELSATEIVIPDEIDGLPVTSIGRRAFYNCNKLKSVSLPNSLTDIGDEAFYVCSSLTDISLPQNLKTIGDKAFSGCKMKNLELPENLEIIGEEAFFNMSWTGVYIPKNVREIGAAAFSNYYDRVIITVDSENAFFTAQDGVLFNKDMTKLIAYTGYSASQPGYDVPEGVKVIGERAFYNLMKLKHLTLPESLVSIESRAFDCSNCCCDLFISKNVESIADDAFLLSCATGFTVDEDNKNYSSLDGVLFDKNQTRLIAYPDKKTNTAYSIPDGVTHINNNAFRFSDLKSIKIPDSVTTIGERAFYSISNLENIFIGNGLTESKDFAFAACNDLKKVYYSGSEEDWKEIKFSTTNDLVNIEKIYNFTPFTLSGSAVTNAIDMPQTAMIIATKHADGVLTDVQVQKIQFEANETRTFDGYDKIFVWDGFAGMKPLTK